MINDELLEKVRWHTAQTSVGPSTLRTVTGTVAAARKGLFLLQLDRLAGASDADAFARELNFHTRRIRGRLPSGARRWGSARKVLNIYLRGVLYNAYLSRAYAFERVEEWLELPLDSYTVKWLRKDYGELCDGTLPHFPGVAAADFRVYAAYQDAADEVAAEMYGGISRVHLDVYYWRSDETLSI